MTPRDEPQNPELPMHIPGAAHTPTPEPERAVVVEFTRWRPEQALAGLFVPVLVGEGR